MTEEADWIGTLKILNCQCGKPAKYRSGHYLDLSERKITAGWCDDETHKPIMNIGGYAGPWKKHYGVILD